MTGGAMGIGRKMSLFMAKMGAKITIIDMNMEEAQKVVQEITS